MEYKSILRGFWVRLSSFARRSPGCLTLFSGSKAEKRKEITEPPEIEEEVGEYIEGVLCYHPA